MMDDGALEMARLLPERAQAFVQALPRALAQHCARTAALARELADRHGHDPEEAARTAWLHDVARHWRDGQLIGQAEQIGLPIDEAARKRPVLLHGPVGAELLLDRGVLEHGPMYDAIYWHTSCRPEASQLELTLFVADKLEPDKLARSPELEPALAIAGTDLGEAARLILEWRVGLLESKGTVVQPVMRAALAWLATQGASGEAD